MEHIVFFVIFPKFGARILGKTRIEIEDRVPIMRIMVGRRVMCVCCHVCLFTDCCWSQSRTGPGVCLACRWQQRHHIYWSLMLRGTNYSSPSPYQIPCYRLRRHTHKRICRPRAPISTMHRAPVPIPPRVIVLRNRVVFGDRVLETAPARPKK